MNWSPSFESYPGPGEQGAVTSASLREIKAIIKEYLGKQHTFDETSSPACPHIPGLGTVVNTVDTPSALDVIGALAYDTSLDILYRDRGGGLGFETIGGTDHGSLLNLTDPDCHTQYALLNGNTPTNVTVASGYKVTGLNSTEAGYATGDVMPYGFHIGEDVSGGAKHSSDIITSIPTDVSLSCFDKIKSAIVEIGPTTYSSGNHVEWIIGRMAFLPLPSADMTGTFIAHPLFNVSPPDDWAAGFTFRCSTSGSLHLTAGVVSA